MLLYINKENKMAKTRERQCEFYEYEGKCSKGREGTFLKQCQICNKYRAKAGAAPRRTDNRRKKLEKINKRESRDY